MKAHQDATPLPEITFLTQDEVRRLFAVITGKRDRALFQLAYHHGLRASEVSLLQRDDIHAKQGRIYIPRVKGSIAKTYPLQPEDLRLVRAYLRTREDDSPSLFISTRGIPLERRSYWDLMQKYGKVRGHSETQAAFSCPAPRDCGASAGRRCGCRVRAGPVGARQYPEHDGVHALHHGHSRCPDTAALCQPSCGLNSPLVSQLPQVLALSFLYRLAQLADLAVIAFP